MTRQSKSRQFSARDEDKRGKPAHRSSHASTPNVVFVGQNMDWNIYPDVSGVARPLVECVDVGYVSYELQQDYDIKAFMGIEGLLRPVSVDGSGGLSPFVAYGGPQVSGIDSGGGDSSNIDSDDPCAALSASNPNNDTESSCFTITQDDLNPLTNPNGFNRSWVASTRSDTPDIGHDYEIVGRDLEPPEEGMIMPIAGYNEPQKSDYADDYRFMALKGPIVLQSWGYDTEGYPVPNKADTYEDASQGIFVNDTDLLECKFMDGHLRKPGSWPVAPVDLRLDRERGVWTAGGIVDRTGGGTNTDGNTKMIWVTGNRDDSKCAFPGILRQVSYKDEGDDSFCDSEVTIIDVWVTTICADIAGKCVIAERIRDCHLFQDGSGYDAASVFQFLGRSFVEPLPGDRGDCYCCCPDPNEDKVFIKFFDDDYCEGTIDFPDGEFQYVESFSKEYCNDDYVPYTGSYGWLYDFRIYRPYPVVMVGVTVSVNGGDPEQGYVRIGYDTWAFESVYIINEDNVPVLIAEPYEILSVTGGCRILHDDDNNIITEEMELHYNIYWECNDLDPGIEIPQANIFLLAPTGHPQQGRIITDMDGVEITDCGLNAVRMCTDTRFGESCSVEIDIPDNLSVSFNPWNFHCMGMCDEPEPKFALSGGVITDFCSLDPEYCSSGEFLCWRVWWT